MIHKPASGAAAAIFFRRCKLAGIFYGFILRALEEDKMLKRLLIKWRELQNKLGREIPGSHRKLRAKKMRAATDCGREVGNQRQMGHLFNANIEKRLAPTTDCFHFFICQTFSGGRLEAENRIEIHAHQVVL
jgi:hypothetical protein